MKIIDPKVMLDHLDGYPFHIELVQVDPGRAQYWLDRNIEDQRTLRSTRVAQYAKDMANGNWLLTSDTIKITTDDELLDGQHRLAAVIEANAVVPLLVAYGVPREVMPVLDIGASRTFADALRMSGAPDSTRKVTAAVVRRIMQWEQGNYIASNKPGFGRPTNPEMLARYQQGPGDFDAAGARGKDVSRCRLGQGMPAGTAFYLFARTDHGAAHQFFDAYISGESLKSPNPIHTLRNRIITKGADQRLKPTELLALFIRTWNAWRSDRPLERVQIVRAGNLTNQNFPLPQ